MNENLHNYLQLIESFLSAKISTCDFEKQYLTLFKSDQESVNYSEEVFNVLDELFANVDEYCGDVELRKKLSHSIDEKQLLERARYAYLSLLKLIN